MNEIETAWVAGVLEGEGSFVTKRVGVAVHCAMTDVDVLERIKALCGGNIYGPLKKRKAHYKDCWLWQLCGKEAADVTYAVLPYLCKRRLRQARKLTLKYETSPRVKMQQRTAQRLQVIVEGRGKGLTHQAIANVLGVDRSSVSHMILEYQLQ